MIDFAIDIERREGVPPQQAIYRACLVRFRPIMMTTMAAMFGALPLALGFGDGAELRRPLGISIVGGLLVSQLLTLYTTPVVRLSRPLPAVVPAPLERPRARSGSQLPADAVREMTMPGPIAVIARNGDVAASAPRPFNGLLRRRVLQ